MFRKFVLISLLLCFVFLQNTNCSSDNLREEYLHLNEQVFETDKEFVESTDNGHTQLPDRFLFKETEHGIETKKETRSVDVEREYESDKNIQFKTGVLFTKSKCNKNGAVCYEIKDIALSKSGIIFSILEINKRTPTLVEKNIDVYHLDFLGNIVFSYRIKGYTEDTYFMVLEDGKSYLEVSVTPPHNGKRIMRVFHRNILTGEKLNTLGNNFTLPFSSIRMALDDERKRFFSVYGKIISSHDLINKSVAWSKKFDKEIGCPPIIDRDSNVYFCLNNGKLVSLSAQGEIIWTKQAWSEELIHPSCILSREREIICIGNGKILKYGYRTKKMEIVNFISDDIPIMDSSNRILVGSYGWIHLFGSIDDKNQKRWSGVSSFRSPISLSGGIFLFLSPREIKIGSNVGTVNSMYTASSGMIFKNAEKTIFQPASNSILKSYGKIFVRFEKGGNIGIYSINNNASKIKSGWFAKHGNFRGTRQLIK
jgi:hypothetical protein